MSDQLMTIVGNLTRELELRFTTGGRGVANGSLACNRRYMKDGEWVESDPTFFNLVVWGQLGENAAASLPKGTRVIATGRLEQRSYETKEGEKRTVFDFIVDDIGPSMKWSTAELAKVARTGGDRAPHPADAAAPASAGRAPDPIYGDEEPF